MSDEQRTVQEELGLSPVSLAHSAQFHTLAEQTEYENFHKVLWLVGLRVLEEDNIVLDFQVFDLVAEDMSSLPNVSVLLLCLPTLHLTVHAGNDMQQQTFCSRARNGWTLSFTRID
jgi:hypothetical protein